MPKAFQTEEFSKWLTGLLDVRAKAKVLTRIERLENGNPGDVEPIGQGLSEMRIDYGPDYRVYFKQSGDAITILLGGNKASQPRDIEKGEGTRQSIARLDHDQTFKIRCRGISRQP